MKINWKALARTPGYKSLKAAMIKDMTETGYRSKAEVHKKFNWVINRAKHHAHYRGVGVDQILNMWETKRRQWWFGYYSEYDRKFAKVHSNSKKPAGIKAIRKEHNTGYRSRYRRRTKKNPNNYMGDLIVRMNKAASKKSPDRWTMRRKKDAAHWRVIEAKRAQKSL